MLWGKSTLIDCLQLIAQCADVPLNKALSWHWGLPSLLNASRTDRKLAWKVVLQIPDHPIWHRFQLDEGQDLCYEVELKGDA
jgi:predicted ATPase